LIDEDILVDTLLIKFAPFSFDDFQAYAKRAVRSYADDKVSAGNWKSETAFRQAEQEFNRLLPDGVDTKDNYLYWIVASEETGEKNVGNIWYASNLSDSHDIFIRDFEIFESFRRQGYASEAIDLLVKRCRELGTRSISLHVFGENHAARMLYEKLGFKETNVMMTKKI